MKIAFGMTWCFGQLKNLEIIAEGGRLYTMSIKLS
ncbi:hypothetical protein AZE42_09038 [Rhizopogon vesiculosus]|uniref:Uncharacterized protein n=1 Tax=Rhizopogon vesiculosus TaxID=180088 RepID=A0A1J8QGI8_9AGAM|nr:hypothetical protein AZE42_09038 [Rhizopogon vesiculosus]